MSRPREVETPSSTPTHNPPACYLVPYWISRSVVKTLYIDIAKEDENLGAGDLADLLADLMATLRDEVLPQSLHHFNASAVLTS